MEARTEITKYQTHAVSIPQKREKPKRQRSFTWRADSIPYNKAAFVADDAELFDADKKIIFRVLEAASRKQPVGAEECFYVHCFFHPFL